MVKYVDFRTNLDVHPITGDLLLFKDEDAINSQLKNLIYTDIYEVFWKPTVGAGVPQTLFENFGPDSEYQIKNKIKETINRYVKRAELIDVRINTDSLDANAYRVDIIYRPINQLEPITLTNILTRTR